MEITIYVSSTGYPMVTVEGSDNDTAKDVAKAYKEAMKELTKEEES